MKKEVPFSTGSGDIFKDFGFSDEEAAALNIKASLFRTLQDALKKLTRAQTQAVLAKMLGVPQPKISDILNGKMSGFSMERIANYLTRLNYEIVIDAHPAVSKKSGQGIEKMKRKKHAAASTVRRPRTIAAK